MSATLTKEDPTPGHDEVHPFINVVVIRAVGEAPLLLLQLISVLTGPFRIPHTSCTSTIAKTTEREWWVLHDHMIIM